MAKRSNGSEQLHPASVDPAERLAQNLTPIIQEAPFQAVRKPPQSPELPSGVRDFEIVEREGFRLIKEPSNDTATVIAHYYPLLKKEITLAQNWAVSFKQARGCDVQTAAIRQGFPTIDYLCRDDQIESMVSQKGLTKPHHEALKVICGLLPTYTERTLERYARAISPTRTLTKKRSRKGRR